MYFSRNVSITMFEYFWMYSCNDVTYNSFYLKLQLQLRRSQALVHHWVSNTSLCVLQ